MSVKTAKRTTKYLNSSALSRPLVMLGAATALLAAGPAHALDPNALPQDPNVVGGAAAFSQTGNTLNVNQSSNRAVIDWRSFDIGSNAQTNFAQPNAASIAVNRVNQSANPTQIQGGLHANGQVWILNPNGVVFGKTAHVDAAGIVASTANIDVNAFMGGSNTLHMSGADHGSVVNEGSISVGASGLAAFVAPSVRNSGTITAKVGKVTLAAGTSYTLDLAGDNLVEIGLGAGNALVDQSGKIVNAGGTVQLSAKAASDVVDSIINVSGVIDASSVTNDGGTIVLAGDNINTSSSAKLSADAGTNGNGGAITSIANKTGTYAGSFSAKGGSVSGDGGSVETSGKKVQISEGISVDTTAVNGALGDWSIDPTDLEVIGSGTGALSGGTNNGASTISAATVVAGLNTTNVKLWATNSITVNEAITSTATGAGKGDLALNDQNVNGDLTINLNAKITLGAGKVLSGQGTTVNVGSAGSIQNGVDVALAGGATVNVADGNFAENVTINKTGLSLLSMNGATTITGQNAGSELGTIYVKSGANNFTLGSIGHGFTIIGIDGAPGIENAAVYFNGANSGSKVQGNIITANGDDGLLTEYNAAVTNLTVDSNTFDGKTFTGATAGGLGFGTQFTTANVPRQLVVISGGSGVTNTQSITFTNNQITGTAGGLNGSAQEQGNTLVTIDAVGATITGNNFAGTTTRYGDALRARGSNTTISGNTFDGTNMGLGTNILDLKDGALSGTFADVMSGNTFVNGSAWFGHTVGGYNYVYRSINNAIGNATAGDTVNVGSGTYAERVTVNKSLTLAGAGMDSTYLTDGIQIPNSPTITGLTFKNFTVSGDGGTGAVVKQGRVTDFTMDGVRIDGSDVAGRHGFASGKFDGAISITNSEFVNIRGWSAFDTSTGGALGHLTSVVFSNNLIENSAGHIVFRQSTPTVGVTISNNIVRNVGDTTDLSSGIFKIFGATTVDFSGNTISDIGANGSGHPSTSSGILDGAALIVNGVGTLNVTNNTFTNNQEAILVGDGNALPTTTTLTGNTFTNNAYDIQMAGGTGAGTLVFGAGNNFVSGAQTQQHLLWGGSSNIDMTQVQFGGKLGSAMTNNELFAVEDLITDGLDNGTSGFASLKAGNVYVTALSGSIQNGVTAASSGNTVNVQAGNYTLPGQLNIAKSLTLSGAGVGSTNITSNSTGYGINVTADNTTLSGFTYNGPTAGTYGIKVQPDTGVATDRNVNFTISNVAINGGKKTGLDLNAVVGGTIDNVSVSGITNGNGIALTDSQNVTITNTTTSNNAWGGLALYQTNNYYDAQVTGVSVDGTNSFNDVIPVYAEDESATNDFGTISLAGFNYVVNSPNNANDVYSWFQKTQQDAINFATDASLSNGNVNVPTATVQGYAGSGVTGNNIFTVGTGANTVAMSIANAVGAATSGGTINVLSGTYGSFGTSFGGPANLTIQTNTGAVIDGTGLTGRIVDLRADGTTITGFTINGDGGGVGISISGQGVTASGNTINGTLTGIQTTTQYAAGNATITGNTITTSYGVSLQNTGNTVSGNNVTASAEGVGLLQSSNSFSGNTFNIGAAGNALVYYGAASVNDLTASGNTVSIQGGGVQGAVDLAGASGTLNVANGTYSGAVNVTGVRTLNFGTVTLNSLTLGTGAAGSSLSGNIAAGSVALNGATTLSGATTLNTSATNGNITTSAIDGNQALTINAGTGAVSLGSLGGTTRLGAVSVTGPATLTGTTYAASSLSLGTVALASDATLDATGALTTGAVDGAHALTVKAASASLGSLGATTRLGAVSVTGPATLTGTTYAGNSLTFGGALTLASNATLDATGALSTGTVDGAHALTVKAASASLGNLGATTRLGAVSVTGPATLTGTTYAASSLSLGTVALASDATLDATGALTTGAVDGAHALTVKAASASLGNLGATTRLGAVSVTGPATLTGTTYAGNSLNFGGAVTLTGNTVMSSALGGGITVAGDLFGTTAGGQSLTLNAGAGTGALAANGNISLQNVGTSGVRLNNLTVSGNNFGAQTVYLAGNFTATLLGNQVFSSQTLNAGGTVNSNVGGNATGPINSGGAVNMNVGGNLNGNINGTAIALNTGSVTNSNVTGTTIALNSGAVTGSTFTATNNINASASTVTTSTFNAPNVAANVGSIQGTLTGNTITLDATQFANVVITGTNVNVDTPAGVISGTWDTIGTDGSGILVINGETTLGLSGIGPNQLVIEGFALPAGTTVTAGGALVLPTGVLVGLISPAGASGQPRVVLVHSVQRLGELLASGYSAIVIDLNEKKKEDQEIVVASN